MKLKVCDEFFYRISDKDKDIFKDFNTSKENVLRNNERIKVYAGEWVEVCVNKFSTHFVRPAETINDIAQIYNLSVEKIQVDNNLKTSKLYIGQMLKIYKDNK